MRQTRADTAALADPSRGSGPAQDQQRRCTEAGPPWASSSAAAARLCIAHRAAHGSGQPQQEKNRSRQQQHARVTMDSPRIAAWACQCRRSCAAKPPPRAITSTDNSRISATALRPPRAPVAGGPRPGLADQHHRARARPITRASSRKKTGRNAAAQPPPVCQAAGRDRMLSSVPAASCNALVSSIGSSSVSRCATAGVLPRCRMYRGAHGILWPRRALPAFRQQSKHRGRGRGPRSDDAVAQNGAMAQPSASSNARRRAWSRTSWARNAAPLPGPRGHARTAPECLLEARQVTGDGLQEVIGTLAVAALPILVGTARLALPPACAAPPRPHRLFGQPRQCRGSRVTSRATTPSLGRPRPAGLRAPLR